MADNYTKLSQIHDILKGIIQTKYQKDKITFLENQSSIERNLKSFDIKYQVPKDSLLCKQKPEFTGYSLLHFSVEYSSCEAVDLCLKYHADITCKAFNGFTPLRLAFEHMKDLRLITDLKDERLYKIASKLLSAHIDLNIKINPKCANNISHFHIACLIDIQFANFFIDAGFDVNETVSINSPLFPAFAPLHFAVRYGHSKLLQKLLQCGARPDQLDDKGRPPLQLLVDFIIEINDVFREDPLNCGKSYQLKLKDDHLKKSDEVMEILITAMGSFCLNQADDIGFTFLHASCTRKNQDYVKKLLKVGVNINESIRMEAPRWPGYTPLHFAARCNLNTVILLLEKGANLVAKDANGITPFDLCVDRYKSKDISRILKMTSLGLIKFSGNMNLVDVLPILDSNKKFNETFISSKDLDVCVPLDSPIWPGYTLLHLIVLTSKTNKYYTSKHFVIKNLSWESNITIYSHQLDMADACLKKNSDLLLRKASSMTPIGLAVNLKNSEYFYKRWYVYAASKSWTLAQENLVYLFAIDSQKIIANLLKDGLNPNWTLPKDEIWYVRRDKKGITFKAGSSLLHIAALAEANKLLIDCVKIDIDVSVFDANGLSPVQLGFVHCKSKKTLFNLLSLSRAQKINCTTKSNLTHLHIACYSGNVKAAQKLVQVTTNINEQIIRDPSDPFAQSLAQYEGYTPLHFAIQNEYSSIVSLLIKNGADIFKKNAKGLNSLHFALQFKNVHTITQLLIKKALETNNFQYDFGITKLHLACFVHLQNPFKKILKPGENMNSQINLDSPIYPGDTPHHILSKTSAPKNVFTEIAQQEIDFTIKNADNLTSLLLLYDNKVPSTEKVDKNILLIQDINKFCSINAMNNEGLSHLHICCHLGELTYVEKFLQSGANVNAQIDHFSNFWAGFTPLHVAVLTENHELIALLLKYGANILAEDKCGLTPVHHIVIKHPFSFVKRSIEDIIRITKFDLFNCDTFGKSVFEKFLEFWNDDISNLEWILDKYDSYINLHQPPFNEMLKILGRKPGNDIIQLLVKKNIDFSVEDSYGHNVLSIVLSSYEKFHPYDPFQPAIDEWFLKNVETLANVGCDIDHRNFNGETVLLEAVASSDVLSSSKRVFILLALGADINIPDNTGQVPYKYVKESPLDLFGNSARMLLEKHISKMTHAGLHISSSTRQHFENFQEPFLSNSEVQILSELSKMKEESIGEQLSVRNLLTEQLVFNFHKFKGFKRRAITELLGSDELVQKYPGWRGLFRLQRRRMLACEVLFKSAVETFQAFTKLPLLCIDIILEHLNNEDLKNLINIF